MSTFPYFSKNGKILLHTEATVSLYNLEYSYGYGVYETLKIRNKILYFVDQHLERLEHSANTIDINLPFTKSQIKQFLGDFIQQLKVDACNIKIILIGGEAPDIYIFASAPLFPDRKLYKEGARLITYTHERLFPTAKTLNMLSSYLAYKKARNQSCYDALFIDHEEIILEGTRTNFCLINGTTIYRAPEERILGGVTFLTLSKIAEKENFTILEKEIPIQELDEYDGAFITSTSTKIMPVSTIDDFSFQIIPASIRRLMKAYDSFLEESQGIFQD